MKILSAITPVSLLVLLTFCSVKHRPYEIFQFKNVKEVNNYTKSYLLSLNESEKPGSVSVVGEKGDLFLFDNFLFWAKDTISGNKFDMEYNDTLLTSNGKITSIYVREKDYALPFLEDLTARDLSALQFIGFEDKIPAEFLPVLTKIGGIRPDAGLVYNNDFSELKDLLQVFRPRVLAEPVVYSSDYALLAGMTDLQVLTYTPGDSLIIGPLPFIPKLTQLFLSNPGEKSVLPVNLLQNNGQITKFGLQKKGSFDLSLLQPLKNLRELVIRDADTILNPEKINEHLNLEVLSLAGKNLKFDPSLIKLPHLRWITIPSCVPQSAFEKLIDTHPDLEIVEIFRNDTITNLQPLGKLPKLFGLTIVDTLTDAASVRILKNLKYLSLPLPLLDDSIKSAGWKEALPGTTIVANEGFCLGSGWLLLVIPLILIPAIFRLRKQNA